jgi:hypothetical protein
MKTPVDARQRGGSRAPVVTAPASRFTFDRRALVRGLGNKRFSHVVQLDVAVPTGHQRHRQRGPAVSLVATAVRGPSRSRPPAAPALKV